MGRWGGVGWLDSFGYTSCAAFVTVTTLLLLPSFDHPITYSLAEEMQTPRSRASVYKAISPQKSFHGNINVDSPSNVLHMPLLGAGSGDVRLSLKPSRQSSVSSQLRQI